MTEDRKAKMLRDMDEKANMRRMTKLDHQKEFDDIWNSRFTDDERRAMIDAVDGKLDELIAAPDKQLGLDHEYVDRGRES